MASEAVVSPSHLRVSEGSKMWVLTRRLERKENGTCVLDVEDRQRLRQKVLEREHPDKLCPGAISLSSSKAP